jgi:hypothetical protein
MRPKRRRGGPARAASCSKASSHCPVKGRKNRASIACARHREKARRPYEGALCDRLCVRDAAQRETKWSDAALIRDRHKLGRSRVCSAPLRFACAALRPGHSISTPARRNSTNGKPPGGDPAAPVRRRSCRGAGSATAGARLVCGDYKRCPPGCSMSIAPPSVRCGPQWCIPSPSRPRNPPRSGPVKRLSIAKRRF